MAEMLSPLTWTPPDSHGDEPAELRAKLGREAFQWPTPPYAPYPAPIALTQPVACQIVGTNEKRMTGRLTFFVPEEQVAHVQLPPARTTLPLRFDQFRSLTLMTALLPSTPSEADSQFAALSLPEPTPYRLQLKTGSDLAGMTIGHVETEFGLFLFPPQGGAGAVTRMFVPRAALAGFEIGPRIGEVLLAQRSVTPQQVDAAVSTQQALRQQKIGDILVTRQVVSPEQLLEAIERQSKMPLVRIGEALLSLGMVTDRQLQEALSQQKNNRSVPLGELLVRMGVVSLADLQTALARKMGYPLVNLDVFPVEPEALRRLSYSVALRLQVMPLLVREGRLVIAMDDPARRRAAVDEVEFNAQMKVVAVLAHSASLEAALHAAYDKIGGASGQRPTLGSGLLGESMVHDTDKLVETLEKEGNNADDDQPIEQSDNSLVRLINNMVIEAHREGVSDIHVESYPGREKIRIRFRKDGLLRTYLELPPNYRNALIARIKIMCDLDISERRKPQDGKINFSKFSPSHKLELRVATIPTNSSLEDVVIRILASAKPMPMDRLDLSEINLAALRHAIERPYGMVLCVGPTGSGKTTTLHSALSHINVPERKIWTAEDPIEITQPGLRQVQVNPKIDWTFAKALRAFLRADPDVVMVGEIRDAETAQVAIEASLTGHLVMSTLHTNSAPETVTRLLDMGMDPFNFADSLLAVLAQRLVRRLCVACRQSRPATPAQIDELLGDYMHAFGSNTPPVGRDDVLAGWKRGSRDGRLTAHHSPGCAKCDNTGFKGRAGMHELMTISRDLRHLIQTGSRSAALQQVALAEGMRTLRQDGIDKVLGGVTTMEEVRAMSNI